MFIDFDRTMNRFLGQAQFSFNPTCDVEETENHYEMSFDLPGIPRENIKIEVVGDQLTVSGERKLEKDRANDSRYLSERAYGKFRRIFTLPSTSDLSKVEASYKDGVLTVSVPKPEVIKPREIKILDRAS